MCDAAFLQDVAASGAKIAATDEVTVFKFNAAWRRDAYRLKPTGEQEAMIERIVSGEAFRERELLDVMRSSPPTVTSRWRCRRPCPVRA